jgi:hypothetical protein
VSDLPALVLRRFAGEPLEIVALAAPPAVPVLERPRGCAVRAAADGEMQVYVVEVPAGYAVLPVDWRRFATDPEQVRQRVVACVRDNLEWAAFEPKSADVKARIVEQLRRALGDLTSMLDVLEVGVEPHEGADQWSVRIAYRDVSRQVRTVEIILGERLP